MGDIDRVNTTTLIISRTKKKRHLTQEHKDKIQQAKAGKPRSAKTIASISNTLKSKYAAGEHTVPRREPRYKQSEIDKMKQAYLLGTPVSELQKIYKLSRTTIYKYLKDCQ
jgi:Mor family transcriptional regulator